LSRTVPKAEDLVVPFGFPPEVPPPMPTDPQALARSLHDPGEGVGQEAGHARYAQAFQSVVDAARAMFEADGAALMLNAGDAMVCVASTDAAARAFEEAQISAGQGPCHDAVASGAVVAAVDVASGAWPSLAGGHPVRAVLSAPVDAGGTVAGSLCVSAHHVRRWSQADRATVGAYAGVVSGLLEAEIGLERQAETVEQLEHALVGRVLIEQAKGVLMARRGIPAPAAFQDIRSQARSERRKVTDVAREVVATTGPGAGGEDEVAAERLVLLSTVTSAALANTRLDQLLADLLERLGDVLAVDAATVLLVDADGRALVQAAGAGVLAGPQPPEVIALGSGLAGRVATTRNAILFEDLATVGTPIVRPALRARGLHGWAGTPLLARGRLVGVLEVGTLEPGRLDATVLEQLDLVAEPVALAIEHARRFERERAARQAAVAARARAELLLRSTDVLAAAGDRAGLARALAELLVPGLADAAMVTLADGHVATAGAGLDAGAGAGAGPLAWPWPDPPAAGEPALLGAERTPPGVGAALVVPLPAPLGGTVVLARAEQGPGYEPADLDTVAELAKRAAAAGST
jgi:GAF domain-containing protein